MYPSKIPQQRARELFAGEIQINRFEKLLGFLDRFSETERREYVALLQANVSEKRPSTRYPKYKFHPTLEARVVKNFGEEQALGAGWGDRQYQPGEEETAPDEPLVEVKEILHKSRSQSLQELLDWLVLRARSIADSHEQARDLKSIPTNLIFSAVWVDHQAESQKVQNAETMSDQYWRVWEVDLHTRIDYAKLRSELVNVLNGAEYVAALEDVKRRNAPPPSPAELSLAEQERNNELLLEIQKRLPVPPPLKEEVPIEVDRARGIDQLIADVNESRNVLWPSTALGPYVLGGDTPCIEVDRNPVVVEYLDKFPNPELKYKEYLAGCRSFARRAGILAGAPDPETAADYWFDCLFRCWPRFPHVTKEGQGWVDNFPAATIQLLEHLKRTGTMAGLLVAPPPNKPNPDQDETAGQGTFDLNNPPTEPYVYRPFPTTVYHHATKRNKGVPDQEALDAALAEGWKHEPPPSEPPPAETKPATEPPTGGPRFQAETQASTDQPPEPEPPVQPSTAERQNTPARTPFSRERNRARGASPQRRVDALVEIAIAMDPPPCELTDLVREAAKRAGKNFDAMTAAEKRSLKLPTVRPLPCLKST